MNELQYICKNLKNKFIPNIKNSKQPVNFWSEKDFLNDSIIDSYVIILRTIGCSWANKSGCSMCGYFNDSNHKKFNSNDLIFQIEKAMQGYKGEKIIKIFNSGSFFDDNEIIPKIRLKILEKISRKAEKISVESRPEYISDEKLINIKKIVLNKEFEIGIGLETTDDDIRKYSINKGFDFKQYKKAIKIINNNKFKNKTYLLLKPPFLTEKDAIIDVMKSIKNINKMTDLISLNPTNIQKNTYVEYLWKRNLYSPPWIWSILDVLLKSKKILGEKRIKSDIVGGGNQRGPHNCGKCDKKIIEDISKFSLNQDIELLKNHECECHQTWLDQIDIEKYLIGSQLYIDRKLK